MPSKKDKFGLDPNVPTKVQRLRLEIWVTPANTTDPVTAGFYCERVDDEGNDAGVREGDMWARWNTAQQVAASKLVNDAVADMIAGVNPTP